MKVNKIFQAVESKMGLDFTLIVLSWLGHKAKFSRKPNSDTQSKLKIIFACWKLKLWSDLEISCLITYGKCSRKNHSWFLLVWTMLFTWAFSV